MALIPEEDLKKDVLTLRLSYLSRSAEFREYVLDRLKQDEDPFQWEGAVIGGINFDIVDDGPDAFAEKLEELLGAGAGQAYLDDADALTPAYLRDTSDNRYHLWEWWKEQAGSHPALAKQIRQTLMTTLDQGTAVSFTGEYGDFAPEAVIHRDAQGPSIHYKTVPGENK